MIASVLNCQEAYAKALCVPRTQWLAVQSAGDVLGAHELLKGAYRTDVRPLLREVRREMGVPADPLAAYRAGGYEQQIARVRGTARAAGGYQS